MSCKQITLEEFNIDPEKRGFENIQDCEQTPISQGGCQIDCSTCVWASNIQVNYEDEDIGENASLTWGPSSEPICQIQLSWEWKPGYPELLNGTNWTWFKINKRASKRGDSDWRDRPPDQVTGYRESSYTSFQLYQCQNGEPVDITSEAVTFPSSTVNGLTQDCGEYVYAYEKRDYLGGQDIWEKKSPEEWLPSVWGNLIIPPFPEILVCQSV